MRAFLTGGTGFIGNRLAEKLRERGDEVLAAVRSEARAAKLTAIGCEVIELDLHEITVTAEAMSGCDAVFHLAGHFQIGVPPSERTVMKRSNPELTSAVIDAAVAAQIRRIVYASTINVYGNTNGAIVDETFKRTSPFLSLYDESKYEAHCIAEQKAEAGAPMVMVHPGVVYGPGDHFETGRQIILAAQGKLPLLMLGDLGMSMAFVDDVADGFVSAHDKGQIGESYIIAGEIVRLRQLLERAAKINGKKFRPVTVPTRMLKLFAPLGPTLGPKLGYPPNFRELIRVSDGVTYWASSEKAKRALGYKPTELDEGLRRTIEAGV